jgi:5'-nucleotidase
LFTAITLKSELAAFCHFSPIIINSILQKPTIFITNDDGIYAPGIKCLKRALEGLGSLKIIAPLSEKSAVGHAITLSDPLRVSEVERDGAFFGYAVSGTPADCIKLGCRSILDQYPDLVVSGINQGPNTATNIIYSGTVSAAAEAAVMGVPAIAISLASFTQPKFEYAQTVVRKIAELTLKNGIPQGTLLNINVPAVDESEIKGIKITRQGKGRYEEAFDKRIDPNNRTYYWLTGKKIVLDTEADLDDLAVMNHYVSITPIKYELTDYGFLEDLKQWKITP